MKDRSPGNEKEGISSADVAVKRNINSACNARTHAQAHTHTHVLFIPTNLWALLSCDCCRQSRPLPARSRGFSHNCLGGNKEERGYVKIRGLQRHSATAWSQAGARQNGKEPGQGRHNNPWLTLRPDEDFESKAASSSLVVGDGGCGNITQSSEHSQIPSWISSRVACLWFKRAGNILHSRMRSRWVILLRNKQFC